MTLSKRATATPFRGKQTGPSTFFRETWSTTRIQNAWLDHGGFWGRDQDSEKGFTYGAAAGWILMGWGSPSSFYSYEIALLLGLQLLPISILFFSLSTHLVSLTRLLRLSLVVSDDSTALELMNVRP